MNILGVFWYVLDVGEGTGDPGYGYIELPLINAIFFINSTFHRCYGVKMYCFQRRQCVISRENAVSFPERTMCCFQEDSVSFPKRTSCSCRRGQCVISKEDIVFSSKRRMYRCHEGQCAVSKQDNLTSPKPVRRNWYAENGTSKPLHAETSTPKFCRQGAESTTTKRKRCRFVFARIKFGWPCLFAFSL